MDAYERQVAATLTPDQQLLFASQMAAARRSEGTTFVLALFGLHRFYLGQVGIGILYWMTLGGFGLWWLIDLILARSLTQTVNAKLALRYASSFRPASLYQPNQFAARCPRCQRVSALPANFCEACGAALTRF